MVDFSRFTDRSRKVMNLAQREAAGHKAVTTGHLLLGIFQEGSGIGASILKNLDVGLSKPAELANLAEVGGVPTQPSNILPYSIPLRDALEHAIREAKTLHHNYVGTEHLLLGILDRRAGSESSVARQWLKSRGVSVEQVREEVLVMVAPDKGRPAKEILAAMRAGPITAHRMEILPPAEFFRISEKEIIKITEVRRAIWVAEELHIDLGAPGSGSRVIMALRGEEAKRLWDELQRRCDPLRMETRIEHDPRVAEELWALLNKADRPEIRED